MTIRKPHLTSNNRINKAVKIEKIISIERTFHANDKILEVGTGSGGIASYFANHNTPFFVSAVDIIDDRIFKNGYDFKQISGVNLPFSNEEFDVIITNHVIEHVGEIEAQLDHLKEIKRILKKDEIAYLAVPNRWMLIEPHYQHVFLSWLPKKYRSAYLKKIKKINFYDCEPSEKHQIESLFNEVKLNYRNRSIEALRIFLNDEKKQHLFLYYIFLIIPDFFVKFFLGIIPTLMYTLRK